MRHHDKYSVAKASTGSHPAQDISRCSEFTPISSSRIVQSDIFGLDVKTALGLLQISAHIL
jgi:hypothetical protein